MIIYLDHAGTSWPKPEPVVAAVQRWYLECGVSEARGEGPATGLAQKTVARVRQRLAKLCGVQSNRVAFTSGATESLNLFLRGFLKTGDRVLTTAIEHSSLVRPLMMLRQERRLELEILPLDSDGNVPIDAWAPALRHAPRLVCFSHASNVTGAVLDAATICAMARQAGAVSLLDASQTAGLLPIDVGADAVVASAHKCLLGPPGLGLLAVRDGLAVAGTKFGGSGSSTALDVHPTEWPTVMEAGTPNTPAIFGLDAALDWHEQHDAEHALAGGLQMIDRLADGLSKRSRIMGPHGTLRSAPRVPVLSVVPSHLDPAEAAAILAAAGVQVRAGFHCAPWIHDGLGTPSGTLRLSVGPFNRIEEIDRVLDLLGP